MPRKKIVVDDGNPEWTKEDFARAKPLHEMFPASFIKKNFPRYRGPQKTPTKVPVSIRLSPVVVAHFKAAGPGWQARIDEALLRIARRNAATRRKKSKAA